MNIEFFRENAVTLSKNLLGKYLVRKYNDKEIIVKIVETEAYMGINDKAAHVYGDRRTKRTEPLYEDGGTIYVYLIYGMYYCLNISANIKGIPECVLIRAVEPIKGIDEMSVNRYNKVYDKLTTYQKKNITNGPGKLCKALKIEKDLNFKNVLGNELFIIDNYKEENFEIMQTKRINIDYSKEAKDYLFRHYIKGNNYVSKK